VFFYRIIVKALRAGICHEGPCLTQNMSLSRSYPHELHTVRGRDFLDSPAHECS